MCNETIFTSFSFALNIPSGRQKQFITNGKPYTQTKIDLSCSVYTIATPILIQFFQIKRKEVYCVCTLLTTRMPKATTRIYQSNAYRIGYEFERKRTKNKENIGNLHKSVVDRMLERIEDYRFRQNLISFGNKSTAEWHKLFRKC